VPSVAQITTFYENLGGVERSVRDLSLGLCRADYDVTVLCTKTKVSRQYDEGGVSVVASGSSVTVAGRPVALGLFRQLKQRRFDLKHFHLPFPLGTVGEQIAGDRSSAKVVSWHHGLGKYPLFETMYRPALRRFLKTVDKILVTAPPMIKFSGVLDEFADKCVTVPLGIDTTHLERVALEQVALIKHHYSRPVVLFVGRLVYYKGCDVLIRAMKNIDADLVIAGDGPLRMQLARLVAESGLGDKVHFAGRVSDEELAALYHACDLFVLPSVLPTECFGLVQVEAMACGKPVINTNLPTGVPWVSRHGETGLTVKPDDVAALEQAIHYLLEDSSLRAKFAAAARERAYSQFTIKHQIERTLQIYDELLAARQPRRISTEQCAPAKESFVRLPSTH